ncbi:MAG TPA: tRNA (adenosine(37)-N6)-dimethylallyltransferase MiaA [Chlamydiales bacterium]|nr:tRNA (adenosine(37)-N6)-dimethylallyltransferase MiaA [Chlamydiales bacterium]
MRQSGAIVERPLKKKIPARSSKKRVIVISGPTAIGKTNISLSIAQTIGGEIISADSCQVYRGMDIGTAKVTPEDQALITHHMIDICDIDEVFNVAAFEKCAKKALHQIFSRENVPIIVGGSGFYIRTLLYGPPMGPPSDKAVRDRIEKQMEELGPEFFYERLQLLDPTYAETISAQDRQKIVRAFEIMTLSERKVSDFPKPETSEEQEYDFRCWFLYSTRDTLYSRIEARCEEIIQNGFLDEVRMLDQKGLRKNPSASQAIGYRQALEYLDSPQTTADFEEFKTKFKKATRHFAKRQFTWFRKEPMFRWLDINEYTPDRLKEIILQDYEQG